MLAQAFDPVGRSGFAWAMESLTPEGVSTQAAPTSWCGDGSLGERVVTVKTGRPGRPALQRGLRANRGGFGGGI